VPALHARRGRRQVLPHPRMHPGGRRTRPLQLAPAESETARVDVLSSAEAGQVTESVGAGHAPQTRSLGRPDLTCPRRPQRRPSRPARGSRRPS
jgi:hypothetical protein